MLDVVSDDTKPVLTVKRTSPPVSFFTTIFEKRMRRRSVT